MDVVCGVLGVVRGDGLCACGGFDAGVGVLRTSGVVCVDVCGLESTSKLLQIHLLAIDVGVCSEMQCIIRSTSESRSTCVHSPPPSPSLPPVSCCPDPGCWLIDCFPEGWVWMVLVEMVRCADWCWGGCSILFGFPGDRWCTLPEESRTCSGIVVHVSVLAFSDTPKASDPDARLT
jgi:hypothetical protein